MGEKILKCFECWVEEFGVFSKRQRGATECHSGDEDWVGGASTGGRETKEEASRRTGGQRSLKTRDELGAHFSVFPFGKYLSLDTSLSGDLLALVSDPSGESLFAHPMSSWSLWETVDLTLPHTSPFTFDPQSPPWSHWR